MKNTILNRNTVNLAVVALLTLLFAGCAVAPKAENLSGAATYLRTVSPAKEETNDLQPNPSDSPGFHQWGGGRGY